MLERLTRDGARVVFYDIFFETASADPAVDAAFAEAMKKHGNVVLSGLYEDTLRDGAREETTRAPTPLLRDAARGWGIPAFLPLDPDNAVRLLGTGLTDQPLSSWLVAEIVGAPVSKNPDARKRLRWLRYYGPSGAIAWRSFYQALDETLVPADFFRGKIVCIGSKPALVARTFGEDEFANPFSRWTELFSPGLEIHATALLNLIRGDWLERMPVPLEVALVVLVAIGSIIIGYGVTPKRGMLLFLAFALLLGDCRAPASLLRAHLVELAGSGGGANSLRGGLVDRQPLRGGGAPPCAVAPGVLALSFAGNGRSDFGLGSGFETGRASGRSDGFVYRLQRVHRDERRIERSETDFGYVDCLLHGNLAPRAGERRHHYQIYWRLGFCLLERTARRAGSCRQGCAHRVGDVRIEQTSGAGACR